MNNREYRVIKKRGLYYLQVKWLCFWVWGARNYYHGGGMYGLISTPKGFRSVKEAMFYIPADDTMKAKTKIVWQGRKEEKR